MRTHIHTYSRALGRYEREITGVEDGERVVGRRVVCVTYILKRGRVGETESAAAEEKKKGRKKVGKARQKEGKGSIFRSDHAGYG